MRREGCCGRGPRGRQDPARQQVHQQHLQPGQLGWLAQPAQQQGVPRKWYFLQCTVFILLKPCDRLQETCTEVLHFARQFRCFTRQF